MAIDRRITDLDSIGALSTGDLFLVTDADQSNIAKNATIDILVNYVLTQVPSSARAFGGAVNEIATWAEGNNTDIIPSSKLPTAIIPDLSNYVTLDTAQHITGDKILSAGTTLNSQTIITAGNAQTILGKKTINEPDLTGTTDIDIIRFSDGSTQNTAFAGSGGIVTKAAVDAAIGVFPTGDSAQFYNEQGNFIDAVYDSVEDAPIIRNRTIESIVLSGTRSNVQAILTGTSEMSVITMQNTFDSSPTQYTTTFTSPNTTFTPALVFPAGSQGRQLSLTEADGTLHRFCYLVNGNFRLLAGGLTGTVRLGPIAVATTATVTAAVTVPDQTAGQTITLAGDETGTFSVGDFISPQANNFGAYRGIFIDSITFDGTNTVIVGPSNGATTFNTTSVLRNAGPATEIQGTIPTFSGDPDTANTVYSSSIPATEFTVAGVNTSAHLIQVANAFAALETAITTDGIVTDNGDGTSSITVNYNTETNIDSSFTITGGLNNMESIVNVDGMIGDLSPATTITLTDPEATEVVSFTSSAATTATENVDDIAAQLVLAINNNIETPINFDAEYDQATKTIILTAERAGNTNPWTIIFDNNGVTNANAGDLGYTSSQTGEVINQIERISIVEPLTDTTIFNNSSDEGSIQVRSITGYQNPDTGIRISNGSDLISFDIGGETFMDMFSTIATGGNIRQISINPDYLGVNFSIFGDVQGPPVFQYDNTTDTLTARAANVVGFGGGADGLSITDTVNLNLLEGTTVLSTVVLPSSSGTTVIAGTANEIINTVSGDTNTLSLAPAITDAITANTAKTGITTAQAAAITSNTGKTGITIEQSNAIIANTSKTGITTAQASAIVANTAKVSNVDILPLANTFTAQNTFSEPVTFNGGDLAGGSIIVKDRISNDLNENTNISISSLGILLEVNDDIYINCSTLGGVFSSVTINSSRNDIDFVVRGTTNDAIDYNAGADVLTIGSDVLTIDSTTINGLPSKADALSISGQVLSLLDGTTSLSTVTLPSGGTATTVQGTSGQIGVNTVGNTATVSLDTAITGAITTNTAKVGITTAQATAITANTAKVSVAGLNQVGAAVLSTDSVVYYAGTALAPRRKTFSLVPLSIMNNDAGFITGITKANVDTAIGSGTLTTDYYASDKTWKTIPSGGTATTVLGTTGEIDVATVGSNATVSLSSTITDAIDLNTAKQSVAGLTQVGGAIIASDSVLYYDGTVPRRKVFSSVPLSVFNNDSGFTTNTGTVTNVTGTVNQINVANGITTPAISLSATVTNAIQANTGKVGITTAQANAITANTSKTGITTAQANAITANTSKTGITTAQANAITANTAKVSNIDILPLDNTFTGTNTFSNPVTFNGGNLAGGSIIVKDRISNDLNENTNISISSLGILLEVNDDVYINCSTLGSVFSSVIINPSRNDIDFTVRGTTNDAIDYDAGTDTLDFGAANITGVATSETGTWTPVLGNLPTGITPTAVSGTYNRVGDLVTLFGTFTLPSTTSTFGNRIETSSLPFTINSTTAQGSAISNNRQKYLFGETPGFGGVSFYRTDTSTNGTWGDLGGTQTEFSLTYTTT